MKTILITLLLALAASAQQVPEISAKINDETVLFNFRGENIRAADLPDRTLGCRMYIAKRRDMGFPTAMHEEYTSYVHFKPIESLTRVTVQVDFSADWESATVWAQGETYKFKPLKFKYNGLRYTHQYDELKDLDPERSRNAEYRALAAKALDKKEVSKIIGIQKLAVRWAPVDGNVNPPHSPGYTIHIFDRISAPRFHLQVSETSDPINDEWFPSLWGDQNYFEEFKIIPKLGRPAWKDAVMVVAMPTIIPLMIPGVMDWSTDEKILRGAYCYPGAPRMLDEYEKLPLGKKLRGLEETNGK